MKPDEAISRNCSNRTAILNVTRKRTRARARTNTTYFFPLAGIIRLPKALPGDPMIANNLMLQSATNRLQFWQDQLQTAFRAGDSEPAAECTRFIEEYGLLIAEAAERLGALAGGPSAGR
ncbi:MAG: hypothetical protein ACXW2I_07360 [Burkholderiales bacterium]